MTAEPSNDLVRAFVETQRQTAEAHAAYQRAMADAHAAFLRASEAATAALLGTPLAATIQPQAPSFAEPPAPAPTVGANAEPRPMDAPAPSLDLDPVALMLDVVAEKTGYPASMLDASMELEADLGIDSIKRVEILAALRERAPELPEIDPAALGKLRTLAEIADLLRAAAPVARASSDIASLMLEVVAEKTGYPTTMLDPSMELEADLGIDSIKRVEILAALRERAPGLAELDPAALGKLRTLAEIVALLDATPDAKRSAPPAIDVAALMLEVVAEKTGYPAAMLEPSMELEADLGIDSIKRVEILAALRERAPGLAELDPAELGKLRTLADIVAVLVRELPLPPAGGGRGAGFDTSAEAAQAAPALPLTPARKREGESQEAERVDANLAASIERCVVESIEAPAPCLAPAGLLSASRIAITDDGRGIAERVVARLQREGLRAEKVDAVPSDADAVIVLAGLRDDARAACREAFDVARALAPRFERGGLFVTVADAGGRLGLSASDRAWHAGVSGLAKTAALEWPSACVRSLDIASEGLDVDVVAERIVDELLDGGEALEVGIDIDGTRRVPVVRLASAHPRVSSPPTVVASGGARGVTAACLLALAQKLGGRYLLLGRTELESEDPELAAVGDLKRALVDRAIARGERLSPREIEAQLARIEAAREIRATLAAFERAGAEARYACVDVRDAEAISRALRDARDCFGGFTMLVHGAGVLADRLLRDKRPEDFERVFATKVDGLRALLAATADDPLRDVILFSSVAARYGNAGQSDYAMANSVLDAVAAREARTRHACAIAWGPWDGGMVTPELASHFAARGVGLIDLREGAEAFVREATAEGPSHVVLGAPLSTTREGAHRFDVRVSRETHAYLLDHIVKDVPVLPVVLVVDWMARAARSLRPHLFVARVRDIAVLRGLPLASFASTERSEAERGVAKNRGVWGGGSPRMNDSTERFELALTLVGNGHGATYRAELRDARGTCYRADVDLLPELPLGAPVQPSPADLETRKAPIYGGCLFHGERFRVIRELEGIGKNGAAGTLVGTRAKGWGEEGWQSDPALLDGGLQLAVLWTERRLGGAALPTGIEAVQLYREGPIDGPIRACAFGRRAADGHALCDVTFVDDEGRAVAELRGVSTHVRPSTTDARVR